MISNGFSGTFYDKTGLLIRLDDSLRRKSLDDLYRKLLAMEKA